MGGLFEQRNTKGSSGLPSLSRQPIIGGLFGRQSARNQQTELLVLITPRIVNSNVDARRVTRSLRDRMENIRLDDATLSNSVNMPTMRTENSANVAARQAISSRNAAAQLEVQNAVQTAVLTPAAAPTAGGSHFAFLGAFGTEQAARQHWSTLQQANGSALAGQTPRFAKSGDLVSVAVGPMTAREATQLCVNVRSDCYSARADS